MTAPLVVVGDALLDVDVVGEADRLSPDAPVPVLDHLRERPRPGGAALAAAMAAGQGHDVVLVTALGEDGPGREVSRLLEAAGVRVVRLPFDGTTPEKRRVRAGGQSLVRLDSGDTPGTIGPAPAEVAEVLAGAGAVLVADYGRGVAAAEDLRALVAALPTKIPVVWDPHPRGAVPVAGVRLVTPNQDEAALFARRHACAGPDGLAGFAAIGRQAAGLQQAWQVQAVAVTLGERGALLSYGDGAPAVTPAPRVDCVDPCGAGDMFSVTAALRLAAGSITTEAVQDAVWAAAQYVAAGGPASVFPSDEAFPHPGAGAVIGAEELVRRVSASGGVVVATGGCFDLLHAGHVATLREARKLGDCLVVCLNSDDSVRRLKGPSRPLVPAVDRARVLEALEYVDAVVVFEEDTPVDVLRRIRPDVWAKGGDYAGTDVPEAAVLEEWGGQAVVLPYLKGRSTTALVRSASERADAGIQN
ncbi:MAG TPA: D-glycero-beta-D-manno-heptose 1-phosphate adenylyltransferase [Nocardioidaceae bacterium]|nr:D-glycero-beta-D-manno-heptose 1-phosphate adenylyltransferase [Nocardioidaceae bacterium]